MQRKQKRRERGFSVEPLGELPAAFAAAVFILFICYRYAIRISAVFYCFFTHFADMYAFVPANEVRRKDQLVICFIQRFHFAYNIFTLHVGTEVFIQSAGINGFHVLLFHILHDMLWVYRTVGKCSRCRYAMGISPKKIAEIFTEEGLASPCVYAYEKYGQKSIPNVLNGMAYQHYKGNVA